MFTELQKIKRTTVYLHYKMKIFVRLDTIHYTSQGSRGNSQEKFYLFTTVLYHSWAKLYLTKTFLPSFVCLNILIFVEWNWFFLFRLRLYNKLGIFRGLNPPTRTLNSFTKFLYETCFLLFSLFDYYTTPKNVCFTVLWILAIVVALGVY